MIDSEKMNRVIVKEEDLENRILPILREKVFHVTSLERYQRICLGGAILTNKDGCLGSTFPQSNHCLGRSINSVCLFDLRTPLSEDAIKWGLDCYYFLGPRPLGNEIVFLFLDPQYYSKLLKWRSLDASIRTKGTSIPEVECWYPGDLEIGKISCAFHVHIERRKLEANSFAAIAAASGELQSASLEQNDTGDKDQSLDSCFYKDENTDI